MYGEIDNFSTAMPTNDAGRSARIRLVFATLVTIALAFVPYSDILLYPLRLFVTFVHESGHALAAIATGGMVEYMTIKPDTSGLTYSSHPGWSTWLVDSGGYLGTTVFGALLLQVGRFGRWRNVGRVTLYLMSAYILGITLLWAHNPLVSGFMFTLIAGLSVAGILFVTARFSSPAVANFLASFLAVQCCLNALIDLRVLFAYTTGNLGDNDAKFMADAYGLTPTFWAGAWAIIAVLILSAALIGYWRSTGTRGAIRA